MTPTWISGSLTITGRPSFKLSTLVLTREKGLNCLEGGGRGEREGLTPEGEERERGGGEIPRPGGEERGERG